MNAEAAIAGLESSVVSPADLESLHAFRLLLANPALAQDLKDTISRSHNRPQTKGNFLHRLNLLLFHFRDQRSKRSQELSQLSAIVINGGMGVVGAAVVALATELLTNPLLIAFPIAGGAYSVWRGALANRHLALEISALGDIVEMLERLASGLRE